MLRTVILSALAAAVLAAQAPEPRTVYKVKYIAQGVVYIDGGRAAGLADGMHVTLRRDGTALGNAEIVSVAETSAVCEVKSVQGELRMGDEAVLTRADAESIRSARSFTGSPKYVQVVTFTDGDPLDEEARAAVPRPPLPEINRMRGRIGFEYGAIRSAGGPATSQAGLVFRGDMTRIGGTHWSLSGYWRGRMNTRGSRPGEETLTDLLNRTYHLTLSYDNPDSAWRAGFGRLYLPWAASLETIDGGYFGRRFANGLTAGVFGGSTPDPTSWNYNPDRQLLGSFLSYEGGSFESVRYVSTAGVAVSRIDWKPERQFAFFENTIFYERRVSLYHNIEVDRLQNLPAEFRETGPRLSRSFLTLRVQPSNFLALDFSHNYFRDVPTFDARLVGTGLVDRLLFQGVSVGARVDLPHRATVYTNLGRSDRTGDTRRSLNQLYGITFGNIWRTGLRADVRYSRFDGAFGKGAYKSIGFSREVREALRLDVQIGNQNYVSAFTQQNNARFVNANADWFITGRYFIGSGITVYRGRIQNYEQMYVNLGYRF